MAQAPSGEVLVYEAPDGGVRVEVKLDRDAVWLTQRQMSELFETTRENVLLHLKNIYADGQLEEPATAKDFLAVRLEGKRQVQRQLKHHNLDAIISVGYRVSSRRGLRFRQWATQMLRNHLVRGYTTNRERFEHNARELEAALALVRNAAAGEALSTDQGRGLLVDIIARYTQTFLLLQRYDEVLLVELKDIVGGLLPPASEARAAIVRLKRDLLARGEATELFGREREEELAALLGNPDQSVFGEPAYPTVEAKAAHLLYFVIKNHPLRRQRAHRPVPVRRVPAPQRAADPQRRGRDPRCRVGRLALLVAKSAPVEKEVMIRLVMNRLAEQAAWAA
jgi:hypothetical protein